MTLAQTYEPQVQIQRPGAVGIEQARQRYRHRIEILHSLPMGDTRENTESLSFLKEARVLFSAGDRPEASSEPWYAPSPLGLHHQPAQRHQVFPLPTCNGHIHPETLCWGPGIQVSSIWRHY